MTTVGDRGSILLIVYSALSAGMVAGAWSKIDMQNLLYLVLLATAMLALASGAVRLISKLLGFNHADTTTLLFANIQKSVANGVPMANILFVGQAVSIILLPHDPLSFLVAFSIWLLRNSDRATIRRSPSRDLSSAACPSDPWVFLPGIRFCGAP
ncbi:bile acid:sodium symporter [Mesorhizobium sp. CO1-1-8]|uniref:bile acid:sodium symporter n=1 Tax=Mesorhizobium sp. CO1-1-8 TaxID=2876631 RepID=UPI001CD0D6E7|nr:bile acid:sodium symporter [Mesorhizobium sp. CO1-1-8]